MHTQSSGRPITFRVAFLLCLNLSSTPDITYLRYSGADRVCHRIIAMAAAVNVLLAQKTDFENVPHDNLRKILNEIDRKKLENGLLFEVNSPFHHVTPTLFTTLRLHHFRKLELDIASKTVTLGRHDEEDLITRFLQLCGPAITTISLHSSGELQLHGYDTDRYAKTVKDACQNVRRVLLTGNDYSTFPRKTVDSFIREFAGEVEQLEVRTQKHVKQRYWGSVGGNMVQHVAGNSTALKCFKYTGVSLKDHEAFWEIVGATLEELHLCYNNSAPWRETLLDVEQYCRKLHTVMLDNPLYDSNVDEETFTDVLVSYGDQLLRANLHSLDTPSCRRIVASCPNLRATFIEKRHQFERVKVLGNCIESLRLRTRGNADWEPLREALKVCGRLNFLKIYRKDRRSFPQPLNIECIQSAFSTELSHLQKLHLFPLRDSETLSCVARGTGNLVSVTIEAISAISVFDIEKLADSNPRLEHIHIREGVNRYDGDSTGMYVASVIESLFSRCPRLSTLNIHCTQSATPDAGLMRALRLRLCQRGIKEDIQFKEHMPKSRNRRTMIFPF